MIQTWTHQEMFSWCFWSNLHNWSFQNSRWLLFCMQTSVLVTTLNSVCRFEWSGLHVLKDVGSNFIIEYVANFSRWPPFFILHSVLVLAVNSIGRLEWFWCYFECLNAAGIIAYDFWSHKRIQLADLNDVGVACFKGNWNHWSRFCSPPTCHFYVLLCRWVLGPPYGVVWGLDGGIHFTVQ